MQTQPLALRQRLIEAVDESYHVVDFASIVEVLATLESLPVTKEVLEATRLGRTVNEFRRKVNNDSLAKRAKALVKKWRDQVIDDELSVLVPPPKSTAHFNGNGNSHLVSEGPGPSPGPEISASVEREPEIEAEVVEAETEAEKPKRGRARAKKKKILTLADKIADTTFELQSQLIKAEELKYGRTHPPSSSAVIPPKLSKLIAGDDQSISSPDSPASGAASGHLLSSQVSQPSSLSTQDQMIKNEIVEKYLTSQSKLKSQMERQYQDRLARNEFEETMMDQDDDGETSRSSSFQQANSNSNVGSPSIDVTDAGASKSTNKTVSSSSTTTLQNGTKVSIKGKKKARLKDYDNTIEDSNKSTIQAFESEAEILAKLPPIDTDILEYYRNYSFYVEPEPELSENNKSTPPTHSRMTTTYTNTIETEKCLSSTLLTTLYKTSSFTPVTSNYNSDAASISSTPATFTTNSTPTKPTSNSSSIIATTKFTRKIKVKEPRQRSLFDLSDEDETDEDEDEVDCAEMEDIQKPFISTPPPEPMDISMSSPALSPSTSQPHHKNLYNISNESSSSPNLINNNNNNSDNCQSESIVVESCKEQQQPEEPQSVRIVEDSEVDDLLTRQIVGLNGNYDKTGSFREFHEIVLVETYLGEDFHILPYTIIDF